MSEKVDEYLEGLESPDATERRYAAEDLGELGDPMVIAALADALVDEDVSVREAVVDALVKIGTPLTTELMVKALHSENVSLRNHAIEVLSLLELWDLDHMREVGLKSPNDDVRKFALDVICNREIESICRDKQWLMSIEALVFDPNINVASTAVEILGLSRNPEAIQTLKKVDVSSEWMRMVVVDALKNIAGAEAVTALKGINREGFDEMSLEYIEDALRDLERDAA